MYKSITTESPAYSEDGKNLSDFEVKIAPDQINGETSANENQTATEAAENDDDRLEANAVMLSYKFYINHFICSQE